MSSTANEVTRGATAVETTETPASSTTPLLDAIVREGRFGKSTTDAERGKDLIAEFVSQAVEGHMTLSHSADAAISARIAEIDNQLSLQLNEILHHEKFKKLEATWRGVEYLIRESHTSANLKIKLFNAKKEELYADLKDVRAFDQSTLFTKVFEEGLGTLGGEPIAAMVGDYEFSRHPEDVALLEKIAGVASASFAPFLTAADPAMMGLDDFTELPGIQQMSTVFDSDLYAKWRSFRNSEDSRYVALALPHILMRAPYGKANTRVDGFAYEEDVNGKDHSKYLWGNAAYGLAARVTDSFAKFGWCSSIRGVENGGVVSDLPAHNFTTDVGETVMKCPAEVSITDRQELDLAEQGFVPLVHRKGSDEAVFMSVQSANKPKLYNTPDATSNAKLSAQLPYIFAMARFAHYLKALMRDKIGGFMGQAEAQDFLNRWIVQYVMEDDDATAETKARYPLREARVEVKEVPGSAGSLKAIAFLRPHFQLDELTMSLRLVADLPQPSK